MPNAFRLSLLAAFALGANAAMAQGADTTQTITPQQRMELGEEVGTCTGNRVFGAIQGASLNYDGADLSTVYDRMDEIEVVLKLNSLFHCFVKASGYSNGPLSDIAPPAWPQSLTEMPQGFYAMTAQEQTAFVEDFLGDWAPLVARHMDSDAFEDAYDSVTAAIPLLKP